MMVLVLALIILLAFSALFSAAETSLTSLSDLQIATLQKQKSASARRLAKLTKVPSKFLGAILVGNTITNMVSSSLLVIIVSNYWGQQAVIFSTIALTLFVLIFCDNSRYISRLVPIIAPSRAMSVYIIVATPICASS